MSCVAVVLAGVAAVFFAAMMLMQRSLYACAICLLSILLQEAALFFFFGAPLLAFLQTMVYAGAVMVLIVVTIMAAPADFERVLSRPGFPWVLAVLGLLAPAVEAGFILAKGGLSSGVAWGAAAAQARVGEILFGSYSLATEAVGFLLFLAALAVVNAQENAE